jgi:murein DD-endopeptidase MepM/ murein hydrolase activator NlpD
MSNTDYFNLEKTENPYTANYKPNFVLVGNVSKNNQTRTAFGDIIPVYRATQQLTEVIISSKESLSEFILLSRVFFVCLMSLVLEILNNMFYQSLVFSVSVYDQVLLLPERYSAVKRSLNEIIEIFASKETRGLWWIGVKIDLKETVSTLVENLKTTLLLLNKFYLFILISLTFVALSLSSLVAPTTPNSYITRALENHSYKDYSTISQIDTTKLTPISLIKQENENKDNFLLLRVIEHNTKPIETVESIAEMYGLRPDTVAFNNQITSDKLPETIYLPWTDGYIYKTISDTKIDDLVRIYGVDKNNLYTQNESILNPETNAFPANSYVLIPTTDFQAVAKSNQIEDARKINLQKIEQQKKETQAALRAGSGTTYANTYSNTRSAGLIWPTTGSISRCIQPNHIACDIANFSSPPIFAAQSGVVSAVYKFTVAGYGLAVVIDHGNGLKTLYAHMSEIYVTPGQQLAQGQSIGRMGQTGWATGIHLHFEVLVNGVKQDPLLFLSGVPSR